MKNSMTRCSICGLDRVPEEMVYTRFRRPSCPVCFHNERQSSGVVIRFSGEKPVDFRVFSPYFNFWETNIANFPDPVAGILSFPESDINSDIEFPDSDRVTFEWNWILQKGYSSASRGSIHAVSECAVIDIARSSEYLAKKLQTPFEIFLIFRYFGSFKRMVYEIAAGKDFIGPAGKWCEKNETLIVKELSCLLKG